MRESWRALGSALDRLCDHHQRVSFWLRDDDAAEPTYALERLFRICAVQAIPLLLAVIPKPAGSPLAQMIETQPLIQPCQHGYAHTNHAPAGERAQELGYRPAATICRELHDGRQKLQNLFGPRLNSILVPPWNRYDRNIIPGLLGLGFQAISGFGRSDGTEGIANLNTHVDIIDWRNGRRTKPLADLIAILITELERAQQNNGQVAILTHHLGHDESAWEFLEALFAYTRSHPAVIWRSATEFLELPAVAQATSPSGD
jgi:hypothetical protein